MKIDSSQVALASTHAESRTDRVTEQLTIRRAATAARTDSVSLSQASAASFGQDDSLDPKLALMKLVAEMLLGHKIQLTHVPGASAASAAAARAAAPSVFYQRTETHAETEQMNFSAEGVVQTADGRTIRFSAQLSMDREYSTSETFTLGSGAQQAADPLVVNLNGAPAQVSGAKISFDLDSDGTSEQISFVTDGSGLLVLDRNGDGVVNNGGELFGPASGNGFADLAGYDSDGNGWIDEADPVFAKLAVWTKDASGADVLTGLTAEGIGAISTGSISTEFSLKDSANVLQAQVRRSGVYLTEDGDAGTVQQLDLVTG
jgi:hypothetical protein